jgi:hypothetical protein
MVALADCSWSVVFAVTVCAPRLDGGEYTPFEVIVPVADVPPTTPSTSHDTLPAPLPLTTNDCVWVDVTTAVFGRIDNAVVVAIAVGS